MVTQRVIRSPGPNPQTLVEGDRPGEFLVSFYHEAHCHENVEVDGGVAGVPNNSVIADGAGNFVGIAYEGVKAGELARRAVLARGPAEVSLQKLVFPQAADGPDAGSDTVAETDLLRSVLLDAIKAAGIVVRN